MNDKTDNNAELAGAPVQGSAVGVAGATGDTLSQLIIASLFGLFLLVYMPSLSMLHAYWSQFTEAYAHGYMALGITLYLLYLGRDRIFRLDCRQHGWMFIAGIVMVFASSLLYSLAFTTQVLIVQLFCSIVLIWLWLGVVYGMGAVRHAALPVGVLLIAIPLWDGLGIYLRIMATAATQSGLSMLGIVAYVQEFSVQLPYGVIEIAESCSGLKYLLAGMTLAVVYAELNFNTLTRKMLVLLIGVLVSIVANWFRVFSIVVIADMSDMQSSLVHDHENYGWLVFAVFFMMFLFIANRIPAGEKSQPDAAAAVPQTGSLAAGGAGVLGRSVYRAVIVTLVATLLPVYFWTVINIADTTGAVHRVTMHDARPARLTGWAPSYEGYDEINTSVIQRDGRDVYITLVSYTTQAQGKELIYYRNKLKNKEYSIVDSGRFETSSGLSVNWNQLDSREESVFVVWYYLLGTHTATDDVTGKFMQFVSIMQGQSAASLMAISTQCEQDACAAARDTLLDDGLLTRISGSTSIEMAP